MIVPDLYKYSSICQDIRATAARYTYYLRSDRSIHLLSQILGLVKKKFSVIFRVYILVSISFNIIFVLKRNRLIEMVLLTYTQHMFNCFGRESYIVLILQKPH